MRVTNVHARRLAADPLAIGALIDSLASAHDRLWPLERWPAMRLDCPLGVGAAGGHGPIGYVVEEFEPGRRVRFRFSRPRGFDGYHEFRVAPLAGETLLEHRLVMNARGGAAWSWRLVFRPLHDALIEDALAKAEREITGANARPRWSARVVLLRRVLRALSASRGPSSHRDEAARRQPQPLNQEVSPADPRATDR